MCGIVGLVGRLDHRNRAAVDAMSSTLRHRGPDGDAVWLSSPDGDGWGCLFGHRRLSVLDLTDCAAQPMVHPEGGQALAYNGEVYNFEELREDLARSGAQVTSTGDTEVVLRLLATHDEAALPRLRGMFAFGLWDPAQRTLLLARDPMGMKPLYVAHNPDPDGTWGVVFASELRALLASGLVPRRLDPAAVASVLWNGFVMGPTTAVHGVELLPPATLRRVDCRGRTVRERRYWTLPAPGSADRLDADAFAAELRRSVDLHQVSDVPLAVFLSSGVDSTSVANLAAQSRKDPVTTFTLAFEDEALGEGPDAARIAQALGTEHHEVVLESDVVRTGLARAVETLDQPTFDGLNAQYLSEAVRSAGYKVALVGTGGDELFGGYDTFRQLPRLAAAAGGRHVPAVARQAAAAGVARIRRSDGPVPPQTRWAKLGHLVAAADDLVGLYQLSYALFLPEFQRRLLADGLPALELGMPPGVADGLRSDIRGRHVLPALSWLEQRCFLGERLLRDNDAAAMSVSLEMRLPLVDHVLTEAADRLPVQERYSPVGRKQALRRAALTGLDPALLERPKRGFVLPYDTWLRGPLREQVESVLLDGRACRAAGLDPDTVAAVWTAFSSGAPGLYWTRVWALYVLIAWAEMNEVRV